MPNRIIREGWLESEKIAKLDAREERFFLRLCLRADDFGRFHGNPLLLKSSLFPLCEEVRSTDIPRLLAACESAGLVRCYTAKSLQYVEILRFDQRTRAIASKYPPPPDGPPPDVGRVSDTCQTSVSHPRTYSETETETETETVAPAGASLPFASPEFAAAWADWTAHRKEIKKPLKPTMTKAQFAELELLGEQRAIATIRHTIAKGWQGLREPDQPQGPKHPGMSPNRPVYASLGALQIELGKVQNEITDILHPCGCQDRIDPQEGSEKHARLEDLWARKERIKAAIKAAT